mmetsp:Transcript_50345/g.146049  ORF Transcript_50345/g.146049 Transcript_50345/m.146049 type:complete len:464 (-) Transcript_50345:87-1478(-)
MTATSLLGTSPSILDLSDAELLHREEEEGRRASELKEHIFQLQAQWRHHALQRRRLARELLHRSFASSSFGRLTADLVLPFLHAQEALRWFGASMATASQLSWPCDSARRVHHLRGVAADLSPEAARGVVAGVHWPSVQTVVADLGEPGWAALLGALGGPGARPGGRLALRSLRGLAVSFPAERSAASLRRWHALGPLVAQLGPQLRGAPLRELVLTDLRSAESLAAVLGACGAHVVVCRASFIGPESRRGLLELPAGGLPSLECLMVRHRDFAGQRASRRDRMRVSAASLLPCLGSVLAPRRLRVLALTGICIEGSGSETAALLHRLSDFTGLVAVALRFSVPATFGTLLPLATLIHLRCSWKLLGYFAIADMSLHGFDYWPEQMTDFKQLYPHGRVPKPIEVFHNEFGHVLAAEYSTTAEAQWANLKPSLQSFWGQVAHRLPSMPRSEVRSRVTELFPGSL